MYLESSQPESTKKKYISFGLGIQARRKMLVSGERYFKQREKIKFFLLKCGYANKKVEDKLVMVNKLNCSILMKLQGENPKSATVFCLR